MKINVLYLLLVLLTLQLRSQHLYYRELTPAVVKEVGDKNDKLISYRKDTIRRAQFNYVLQFFPNLEYKNIIIDYRFSKFTARTIPTFFSMFRQPSERTYKVLFSEYTGSTMDSVLISNLSFNSQMGLIANQVSIIDDLSAGGIFNFLKFYFRRMSADGKNKSYREAEERTLEVGLGNQLLSYNLEFIDKLRIENWKSIIGYSTYIHYYRNRPMKPDLIRTFITDLPVYIQNSYR